MIEKLQDFPDNVAAYACHGHLTKADFAGVIPHIQDKLARHKKLRAYTELAPDFRRDRSRRQVGPHEVQFRPPLRLGTQRDSH